MAFIIYKSTRSRAAGLLPQGKVSIIFLYDHCPQTKKKRTFLKLRICLDLLKKIGITKETQINFLYDEHDPRSWAIKKAMPHSSGTYTLNIPKLIKPPSHMVCKFIFNLPNFILEDKDISLKVVDGRVEDDILYFSSN